jgi:cytochrome c oxidase subunit 4
MSDTPEQVQEHAVSEPSHAHEHALPNEGLYFVVFVALAVLTMIELVMTYFPEFVKIPLLLGLAVAKATLVVQFYMHLRYDKRIMTWAFLIPVIVGTAAALILQLLVNSYR